MGGRLNNLNAKADAQMQGSPSSTRARVLERFPREAGLVRQLLLSSPDFQSICEDYVAALDTLARFRARPDASERPEVAEYEGLIGELEAELAQAIEAAQRGREEDSASMGQTERARRSRCPE